MKCPSACGAPGCRFRGSSAFTRDRLRYTSYRIRPACTRFWYSSPSTRVSCSRQVPSASPERLRWETESGFVEAAFADVDTLRLRGGRTGAEADRCRRRPDLFHGQLPLHLASRRVCRLHVLRDRSSVSHHTRSAAISRSSGRNYSARAREVSSRALMGARGRSPSRKWSRSRNQRGFSTHLTR